ncbi:MAG: CtsR family transcriptional regulator [Clostridium sp.]|uniref:CtsR family transcriptional regulator n=1 Tax=Clostridium sp. DSM 8431 TaxID=1761781 RepID=UPI0008EF43D2|nr:CtsR family transcriptional regulator [Clostridium sp. DSM 8431]MCR4945158.1 CtsR family transcriptional regulator [Clostridium sp.]SFU47711.1 transcriptional regulator CtsR [Clostridium sp. DSM 8431]
MARLSDVIESFIKDMLIKNGGEQVQIQRNELADHFRCAPSQINYVLTTRFTYDKGYVIESKRGGGGYIVIRQVTYDGSEERNNIIYDVIGDSITNYNAVTLLQGLIDSNLITDREFEIIKIAMNDRTLSEAEDRNKIRASILKAMLMIVLS